MTNATVTIAPQNGKFIVIMIADKRRVSFCKTEASAMARAKKFAKEHGCEIVNS